MRRQPVTGMEVTVVHLGTREPGVVEEIDGHRVRVVTEAGAVHDFALTAYGWKSGAGVRMTISAP